MAIEPRGWRPGSFTKNFSWGQAGAGLVQLHRTIQVGFALKLEDTLRADFRRRVSALDVPDYVPMNFFLFNEARDGADYIVADELVYWAINAPHSANFDRLAVFALNLSMAGEWTGASPEQRYPAEWAKHFVVDKVFRGGEWDSNAISADVIEEYVRSSPLYVAEGARKLATNLHHIYHLANLSSLRDSRLADWWGPALFLALDRILPDQRMDIHTATNSDVIQLLEREHFFELTAISVAEGTTAATGLIDLYRESGGRRRFDTSDGVRTPQTTTIQGTVDLQTLDAEKALRPVERVMANASVQVRDRRLVRVVRALYDDACALCGVQLVVNPTGSTYCEVGHVKPVGQPINGPDHLSNLLPFCPNHHRMFDRGGLMFSIESGKVLIRDLVNAALDGRSFVPHPDHGLDLDNLRWHSRFFS